MVTRTENWTTTRLGTIVVFVTKQCPCVQTKAISSFIVTVSPQFTVGAKTSTTFIYARTVGLEMNI